jgi:two-component system, chemotaxis family, protein-glutamate methylesterase/glutaminase
MKKIRVVVIDDSAFSRRCITKMLEDMSTVDVVGYAINGEEGIQKIIALKPDLVTLDLEMPKMDGFTLLRILSSRFSIPVIVVSALKDADKVFKALELGALDFVGKPCGMATVDLLTIKEDLQNKVMQVFSMTPGLFSRSETARGLPDPVVPRLIKSADINISPNARDFEVVAIGSSTGGPPALQQIFSSFKQKYPFAIVVSQHMPPGFTKAFADRLDRSSPFDIKEAEDGDLVLPGRVLIAPGGRNMIFENSGSRISARIVEPTSDDRYVPSVDVMLESCAAIYRQRLAAVILTGMGNDGSRGVIAVKENGGYVIAESEDTAIVYGMPREAVATGIVDRIIPLHRVAPEILKQGGLT